jgi:hypothetical protein
MPRKDILSDYKDYKPAENHEIEDFILAFQLCLNVYDPTLLSKCHELVVLYLITTLLTPFQMFQKKVMKLITKRSVLI